MKKHLTSCCSHVSAQERARKGHREHRANNEWLEETDHTAESPFLFHSLQYFALKMSFASGI